MNVSKEYLGNSPLSTSTQRELEQRRVAYFNNGVGTVSDKLNSMTRFVSRQNMAKYLCYHEVFRQTSGVVGSILECGVYFGNGMMTYALLAAALEPYNYQCRIIGFDTFEGDAGVTETDRANPHFRRDEGDYLARSYDDLKEAIAIYDADRPLNHLPKLELVRGDLRSTAKEYVTNNPALTVRILHLAVNLHEPTRAALQAFLPRMPKGAIVAVHGVNYSAEGAVRAVREEAGAFGAIELRTFDFYPNFCYFKIG